MDFYYVISEVMSPKIPIILINWNSIDVLELALQYIQRYTDLNKVTLTVIDNGSDDEMNLKEKILLVFVYEM